MKGLEFRPLNLEDREKYEGFFSKCSQKSSDFTFINLYAWADERSFEIAFGDNLCWVRTMGEDGPRYWSPIGAWLNVNWLETLEKLFPEGMTFERVPESLAMHFADMDSTRFSITEQESEWEYIYKVKDLVKLSGNKFHSKKNKISQFEKKYRYEYVDVDSSTIERILLMQEEWCKWRNCDDTPGLKAEHDAIIRVLGAWDHFPEIQGGAIFIEDYMAAYTIAEKVTEDTLVIHFEKGMTDYRGIYQVINQKFLAENGSSFKWVNREQDMGKEGLRNAKRSYNPDHFLKKYIVQWKG